MLAYLGPSWPYVGLSWPILVPCWPILGLLTSIFAHLGPTWLQHGPNLAQHGPTWSQLGPTWLSNPRFLMDFWGHVGSQNRQKSILTGSAEKSDFLILAKAKTLKLRFRGIKKPLKINPKSVEKSIQNWTSLGNAKQSPWKLMLVPFWRQLGSNLAPTLSQLGATWRILALLGANLAQLGTNLAPNLAPEGSPKM